MSGGVLYDGWCGEPVAWARVGEPVIEQEWTEHGYLAITGRLSPTEAVRKYGPITEVELGRNGGFRSVTYGDKKFICRFVDPRGTGLYDDAVVVVDDPAKENCECPVCEAPPGAPCVDKKGQPRGTHQKRSQGRSRWDIERAQEEIERKQEADRIAGEEALAAEQRKREMATPPAVGSLIEIKRWKPVEPPTWERVPDAPDRIIVKRTYANQTVEGTAETGARMFLARNKFTGDWYEICGQPTSTRLPCRNGGDGVLCRIRHRKGLQLREDTVWDSSADST
ncbi:hypothetical protein ACIBJI_32710 [Nocardia sp. NPDC050408]|uniref:zinc finger domain-containing protein n=1 Tax=Nocardia sp. NPDC050408 TaxID=3364319 RepID=UPI00378FD048